MSKHPELIAEIEDVARLLGIKPSTVGERAGQGGKFYSRLVEGARVWPETEAAVRKRLQQLTAEHPDSSAA